MVEKNGSLFRNQAQVVEEHSSQQDSGPPYSGRRITDFIPKRRDWRVVCSALRAEVLWSSSARRCRTEQAGRRGGGTEGAKRAAPKSMDWEERVDGGWWKGGMVEWVAWSGVQERRQKSSGEGWVERRLENSGKKRGDRPKNLARRSLGNTGSIVRRYLENSCRGQSLQPES